MVGSGGEKSDVDAKSNASLGFSLPFADHAPANALEAMTAAAVASVTLTSQFAGAFFGLMQAAMAGNGAISVKNSEPSTAVAPSASAINSQQVSISADMPPLGSKQAGGREAQCDGEDTPKALAPLVEKRVASKVRKIAVKRSDSGSVPGPASVPVNVTKVRTGASGTGRNKRRRSDDLKKILGIGPKLEMLLNGLGVLHYRDIAGWTEKQVEQFDRELGLDGRIAKDDWIAQAKALLR